VLIRLVWNALSSDLCLSAISQVAAVKAPGFGERKTSYLEDIAILTGAQVIKEELGLALDKVCLSGSPGFSLCHPHPDGRAGSSRRSWASRWTRSAVEPGPQGLVGGIRRCFSCTSSHSCMRAAASQ
jgi:hypothetical protein